MNNLEDLFESEPARDGLLLLMSLFPWRSDKTETSDGVVSDGSDNRKEPQTVRERLCKNKYFRRLLGYGARVSIKWLIQKAALILAF